MTNIEKFFKSDGVIQTYCNGGPISIDEIDTYLYLGNLNAAKDKNTIAKLKIRHIITIDTCPLPRTVTEQLTINNKYIQLSDQPKEDIISHLDETYDFISSAILAREAVLVHCYFGVSRSATVVIAYLMRRYNLSYREAVEKARYSRSLVCPNPGFVTQLRLYGEMGCRVDNGNMHYKVFRLNMAGDKVRKARILPKEYYDLVQPDPGTMRTQPEPNAYRCKHCRRVLAAESNILPHRANAITGERENVPLAPVFCQRTIFLEPLAWMAHVTQRPQERLHCPQCGVRVGSFSWVMGCECPCGRQVAPAFYLTPSKVDFTNAVKNIEVTI